MQFIYHLLFLLIVQVSFCQNGILIGYISINNHLLSDIALNGQSGSSIKVGVKEIFTITLATTSPYRWLLFSPSGNPYIVCRQKIMNKAPQANTGEVLQVFTCKAKFAGSSFIDVKLGTMDYTQTVPQPMQTKIAVTVGPDKIGPTLQRMVSGTVPTIPVAKKQIPTTNIVTPPYVNINPAPVIPQNNFNNKGNNDYYNMLANHNNIDVINSYPIPVIDINLQPDISIDDSDGYYDEDYY